MAPKAAKIFCLAIVLNEIGVFGVFGEPWGGVKKRVLESGLENSASRGGLRHRPPT